MRTSSTAARKLVARFCCLTLPMTVGACDSDPSDACTPHSEAAIYAPDGAHVAQQWVTICGFPGATVANLISVSERPISSPPRQGNFVFFEEQGSTINNQISASWTDSRHLSIVVNALGNIESSPDQIGDTFVAYTLSHNINLQALADHKNAKIHEIQQLERLKTSASWHYVDNSYYYYKYIINYIQSFMEWAQKKTHKDSNDALK